jgi:hypothetical protein
VVVEEITNDLPQPTPLFRDRLVPPPPQTILDLLESHPHAVASGFPRELELSLSRNATDENEPQEGEGFRFAKPASLAVARRVATELDQPGLLRMERQLKLLKPRAHHAQEAPRVVLVLEADHDIIGVTHDDHIAGGLSPPPALGPQIEDVV